MQTKELWHGGALESEDVVNPGDRCDGGPFGAYFGRLKMVGYGPAGVAPSHLIGPAMQCRVRATFVRVHPARVEVSQEYGLIAWDTLVLVRFAHDEVLDVGKWMVLALLREVTERVVLMEILYYMCVEGQ